MSVSTSLNLPGSHAPAAGFDAPFDLLEGCHERVRRTLALLARLVDHLGRKGVDAEARDAARDICRYFDLAAPHHHDDEERHVIPLLLASGEAALVQAARTMQADHLRMHATWQDLGAALRSVQALADGAPPATMLAALRDQAIGFAELYATHVPLEDDLAFPAARARIAADAMAAMGSDMAARRGVHNAAPWSPSTS
jgi:hemerythrin-like domain-containing protein